MGLAAMQRVLQSLMLWLPPLDSWQVSVAAAPGRIPREM
jgi:hypothetical protein